MTGKTSATSSLLRPRKRGGYDESSVKLLTLLTPHLQRAVQLHQKFVDLREHDVSMEAALQTLATPVILTDSLGELLFANRAAEAILRHRHDGLILVRRRIAATVPSDSSELRALLSAAAPVQMK